MFCEGILVLALQFGIANVNYNNKYASRSSTAKL